MDLSQLKAERLALKQQSEMLAAELDARRAEVQKAVDELWASYKQSNAELIELSATVASNFDAKDAELRAAVVAAWPGGDAPKTVGDGLSVKVMSKPVYDEAVAMQWAIEKNLPGLLKLNTTEFKKAADALKPEFVRVESSIVAVVKD